MTFPRSRAQVRVEPGGLVFCQIRDCQFGSSLRAPKQIEAGVRGDPRQPAFHRPAAFKTIKLGKRLQENFLRGFFYQTALPEEAAGEAKHARTIAAHDFFKGRLVAGPRAARQFQVCGLFVTLRQKSPRIEVLGMAESGVRHPVSPLGVVRLLNFALTALCPLRFHLSALLFDLRLLFGC